ncbi:Flp family type IVb pilin [Salinicoccus sp. ID82-1]|uniref:Flp family type IVb pilin n=1 Tax=Salinicoccus sp. ID82-1 TaxID=2820269 RepID=UPI001F3545AB|nr:Flp family type IVb pilin [Salinicoccus sp. ID82-1]MCG1009769.1 Flp family type IVb pilin [Salinicoccus sp. ID82-1]
MMEFFKGLVMEEEGQGMTEYGLILGLLVVAVVAAFGFLTGQFEGIMTSLGNAISNAVNPPAGS